MRGNEKKLMIAALGIAPLLAGGMVAYRLALQPESQLWVEGTSTVRPFKCVASGVEADVVTTGEGAIGALAAGEKAVTTVVLRVPAARLDCANETMNSHMRKAIKADVNPLITFELGSYELAIAATGAQAKLAGTLSLGGATKPIALDVALVRDSAGALRVTGSYDLRMTEYGLKAPSLMMGAMKVKEMVKIGFDLKLKD